MQRLEVPYILDKMSEGYGLKVNSCEASCSLQTPRLCFDIFHTDHNNRGHSSSAGVCQSKERGQAGGEVSTQPVSTCYKGPLKQLQRGGSSMAAGLTAAF